MMPQGQGTGAWGRAASWPAGGVGYHASLDDASALSRTRRTLREALAATLDGTGRMPLGHVDAMIGAAVLSGQCYPSIDGLMVACGPRGLSGLPEGRAVGVLSEALSRLDGLVADVSEARYGSRQDTVASRDIDDLLARALSEANRRVRMSDVGALDPVRAAALRLCALARLGVDDLGARFGLPGRGKHLAGVIVKVAGAAPLGTVAYALFTVEALAYRYAKGEEARRGMLRN